MAEKRIINCTPHDVIIYDEEDSYYDQITGDRRILDEAKFLTCFRPSGHIARCTYNEQTVENIGGVTTYGVKFDSIVNLPEEQEGTYYIVSSLAGQEGKLAGRKDLLIPYRRVRDSSGRIVGCLALSKCIA